jgi:hypothetical protein
LTQTETKRYNENSKNIKRSFFLRSFLVLVLLGVCVFLPLGVYFFVLAQLNRRRHPVMVSGVWDFAGVLFALSGILLLGGPFIMATLNQDWRDLWLRTSFRLSLPGGEVQDVVLYGRNEALSEQWWYARLALWALYFAAICFGAIFLLRRQSRVTSVYNVDKDAVDQSLIQVLDQLQLKWKRAGHLFYIEGSVFSDGPVLPRETVQVTSQAIIGEGGLRTQDRGPVVEDPRIFGAQSLQERGRARMLLEVNPFPAMRHVTLHWSGADRLIRREIEADLAKLLSEVESPPNSAAVWLMSVASILMCLVCFCLLLLILFSIFVIFGAN